MPNVKFRASGRTLTSHAGLSLIGQCLEIAGVDSLDAHLPTTLGYPIATCSRATWACCAWA
ncbi:hypothetical protein [Vreelandella titanicae]|uniref:hypothetical protein n=1 Tax=Vreelandella titanicae TaxID=664683 RepID=UPI0039BF8640